ncbi:MAG: DUF2948 family protein [Emcibacteraceae bacterium]|nr:DUF2948 family protein [Emcibacteraceae bacterium]
MGKRLKLKAQDQEDLTIISAYLQDAVTVVGDFSYSHKTRIFALMINRYKWEDHQVSADGEDNKCCHRIRTGVHFENIISVSAQNIPQKDKKHVLELLAIELEELEDSNIAIDLIFAGDGVIRLKAELIEASMQDVGEAYKAKCHPKHEILDSLNEQ